MFLKDVFKHRDSLHDQETLSKFVNSLHYKNNKIRNKSLFFLLFTILKKKYKKQPLNVLLLSLRNGRSSIITTKVQISGRTHNIAIPIETQTQNVKLLKTLVKNVKKAKGGKVSQLMSVELEHLLFNTRGAIATQIDRTYDTAIDEMAYIHFRWR